MLAAMYSRRKDVFMSFLNSLGNAFQDFLYFNTPGNAVEYLDNLNAGGDFGDRPFAPNAGSGAYLMDFTPSLDDTRDIDPPPSGKRVGIAPLQPDTIDYINAEYAKHYGMDRATAYQEALSNTSYQRAVADMQKAGLNPAVIFGAGRGSGAGAFSGRVVSSGSGRSSKDDSFGLSDTAGLVGSAVSFFTQLLFDDASASKAAGNAAKSLVQTVDKLLSK